MTAYNAVENPGNDAPELPSSGLGWTVCCRRTRPQSATSLSPLWTAVEPHVMAACHTFSIAWVDTLWFLALVTDWGSSTPPGELFISHSPNWTICIFSSPFRQTGQKPHKWEWCLEVSIRLYSTLLRGWDAKPKLNWRGLCWKKMCH